MGAFNTAQNATIGGTGALALLAYNQVQTKNDIINWTAPLWYNTETDTASFDSSYKLCKSYSLPLNYEDHNNLSINNIEVVSTIATIIKNGSTVNPILVSGNTYQYIYDQSGTITFNVDTPITQIDTQANSATTTTTPIILANSPLTITVSPPSDYISSFNLVSGGSYTTTPLITFSGGGGGSTQAVGVPIFVPTSIYYIFITSEIAPLYYTNMKPTLSITGNAVISAVWNTYSTSPAVSQLSSITVVNGGSGYDRTDTIVVSLTGSWCFYIHIQT